MPWKDQLSRMLGYHEERTGRQKPPKEDVRRFMRETVAPALRTVAEELSRHGRETEIRAEPDEVSITVFDSDQEEEFYYAVKVRTFRKPTFAFPELTFKDENNDATHRAVVYTRQGSQSYGIMGYQKEQVIANFMHEYDRQLRWQKPTKRSS